METNNKGSSPFTVGCLTIIISFVLLTGAAALLNGCKLSQAQLRQSTRLLVGLFTGICLFATVYALFADPNK